MDDQNAEPADSQLDEIKSLLKAGKKIEAIKRVREETGRGLKEAKDLVDAIEQKMVADGELEKVNSIGCSSMILLGAATIGAGAAWLFA